MWWFEIPISALVSPARVCSKAKRCFPVRNAHFSFQYLSLLGPLVPRYTATLLRQPRLCERISGAPSCSRGGGSTRGLPRGDALAGPQPAGTPTVIISQIHPRKSRGSSRRKCKRLYRHRTGRHQAGGRICTSEPCSESRLGRTHPRTVGKSHARTNRTWSAASLPLWQMLAPARGT